MSLLKHIGKLNNLQLHNKICLKISSNQIAIIQGKRNFHYVSRPQTLNLLKSNLTRSQHLAFIRGLASADNVTVKTISDSKADFAVFETKPIESTSSELQNNVADFTIPEPPAVPLNIEFETLAEVFQDPTSLAAQGLGGYTPVGLIQELLNVIHTSTGLPWWGSIALTTLMLRVLLFPVVIKSQKNTITLNNNMPGMQKIQQEMMQARNSGDQMEAARCANKMAVYMKEKDVNPLKGIIPILFQAPVFISCFLGIRKMAELPMESFKTGGEFWFTNLTIPDPYFLLPLVTCTTLWVTIELGADGFKASNMQIGRYLIRAMPVVIFPFIMNFPAAILCYWSANNFISLGQCAILRYLPIRNYFGIPTLIKHEKTALPMKKNFITSFKETYKNQRISQELEQRRRLDQLSFKKAALQGVPKTYAYDPTKQVVPKK